MIAFRKRDLLRILAPRLVAVLATVAAAVGAALTLGWCR